jgi:hypothetical protein
MEPPERINRRGGVKKRGRIACRACRQAKVRCGMTQPPCDRCVKSGHNCSFDPEYRRTNANERFDMLESRLKGIEQEPSLTARSASASISQPANSQSPADASNNIVHTAIGVLPGNSITSVNSPGSNFNNQSLRGTSSQAANATVDGHSLGSLFLSFERIQSLFSM